MEVKEVETVDALKKYVVMDLMMPNSEAILTIIDLAYMFGRQDGRIESLDKVKKMLTVDRHEEILQGVLNARNRNN